MHAGAPNAVQIGDAIGYLLLGAAALFFAITGPKYLHLIDKGFPQKRRVQSGGRSEAGQVYANAGRPPRFLLPLPSC